MLLKRLRLRTVVYVVAYLVPCDTSGGIYFSFSISAALTRLISQYFAMHSFVPDTLKRVFLQKAIIMFENCDHRRSHGMNALLEKKKKSASSEESFASLGSEINGARNATTASPLSACTSAKRLTALTVSIITRVNLGRRADAPRPKGIRRRPYHLARAEVDVVRWTSVDGRVLACARAHVPRNVREYVGTAAREILASGRGMKLDTESRRD